ncbi:DUF1972 domain-containing protein [Sphingomonas kyeonggiensis]|uniref:DUF1972 domain-containing protein n=1 Tax=Sphingomonas kyeonggiensis TaxID=1268553 RepID=UPI0028933D82|nr:DUF1972 domain-containing protein [Sphingomonas kyeonggiensis]
MNRARARRSRRVSLVGTVGVPGRYGGFETLAEQLCRHIEPGRMTFAVYCERKVYSEDLSEDFCGHRRVFIPLRANGPMSMLYDAAALLHARFVERSPVVFLFGYSGSWILPLLRLLSPSTCYITNVDGMEWRRDKFSASSKLLLKGLEYFAAVFSQKIIADNSALAEIFEARYRRKAAVIAYGGDHTVLPEAPVPADAAPLDAPQGVYYLAVARIEPENNTEMILEACDKAGAGLVFIGNWNGSDYGRRLRERFGASTHLRLLDPIYDQRVLERYRRGAIGYIHGHSVGGTNPSLVEALFHTDRLLSFDCAFNRATLSNAGSYFADAGQLAGALAGEAVVSIDAQALAALRDTYRWGIIADRYFQLASEGLGADSQA